MVTAAAAVPAQTSYSWGHFLGLAAGVVAVYLIWRVDVWRQKRKGGGPSPTGGAAGGASEKPQVRPVSSHASHETGERGAVGAGPRDGAWYGRLVRTPDGFRRVYRTAQHIARTGESPPAGEPAFRDPDEDVDDVIDVPLDDEMPALPPAYEPDAEYVDDVPDDGGDESEPEPVRQVRETREQYAARLVAEGKGTPTVVAGLIEHYGVSRATAYRLVAAAERRAA